ncbi:organomercurial lyase [Natrarchaeobius sp. A-rgal3]|uniref:organomercurial lyase n=1 Tax=Natrarchaeobius versutus TaxID=1679078 RepID=UPI0035102F04
MSNDSCGCDGCTAPREIEDTDPDATGGGGYWIDGDDVADAPLPDDLCAVLGRFVDDDSIETIADYVAAFRRRTDGPLEATDLCHVDEHTGHWGVVDGEKYDFRCVFDAVILARLVEDEATIHTEAPDGTSVVARVSETGELTAMPAEATVSFGIDGAVDPLPAGEGGLAEAYGAVCPYVRAFSNREAYEAWAQTVPAATVGTSLAGATVLSDVIVG